MSQNFHQNDQIASNPVSREGKSQMQSVPDPLTQDPLTQDPWDIAFDEAKDAAHRGEVPVGACIVSEGKIVARAGNRIIAARDPSAHAEMLAIRAAAQTLGSERLIGCDLYVTLEPCAMCAGAISLARLRRVYYAAPELKGGAIDHGARIFSHPTCHHVPEVYGGIRESQSAELLRDFFKARRS